MGTTFRSSLSSSTSRQTPLTLMAPSLADSLPSVNFGFDELRDRMAKFTAKFDAFIEQGRQRVLHEHNQFHIHVAELQADQVMKKSKIESLQLKTNERQQALSKDAAEKREMLANIAEVTAQRDKHRARCEALRKQITEAQGDIDARIAAQREHARHLETQSRYNVPELDFWMSNLCLRIEGAGQTDRLKFVYTHIDEKDWEREAWFELVTSSRDYDVRHCRPRLDKDKIERVLDRVNDSRELVLLLKGMRELFAQVMKS